MALRSSIRPSIHQDTVGKQRGYGGLAAVSPTAPPPGSPPHIPILILRSPATHFLQMSYAELLWVDYLGMYIRAEVDGGEPQVVRVPFYRPVLDERDARSVITMAAQIAWERERAYTPPVPSIFANAASNN